MLKTIAGRRGASENSIVVEVPAELKSLVKPLKAMIEVVRRKVLSFYRRKVDEPWTSQRRNGWLPR